MSVNKEKINMLVWNGHIRQMVEKSFELDSEEVDWVLEAVKQRLNRNFR